MTFSAAGCPRKYLTTTGDLVASIEIIEDADGNPLLMIVPMSELGARSGGIVAAVDSGLPARLDYPQQKRIAGMIIPVQDIDAYLRSKGVDPDSVPEPGKAALYAGATA